MKRCKSVFLSVTCLSLDLVLGAAIFCLQAHFSLFIPFCSVTINIYQRYYINRFVTSTETQQFNSWNSWHAGEQTKTQLFLKTFAELLFKTAVAKFYMKSVVLSVVLPSPVSEERFSTAQKIDITYKYEFATTHSDAAI